MTGLVEVVRGHVDGAPAAGDTVLILAISAAMTIVLAPIVLRLYNRD